MLFEFLISLTDVYIAGKVGKEIQAGYGFVIQFGFIFIVVANPLTVGTVSVSAVCLLREKVPSRAGDTRSVLLRVGFCLWLIRIPRCYPAVIHLGLGPK